MEVVAAAVLGGLASSVTSKLFTVAEKMCKGKDKESKDLQAGIKELQKELRMIYAAMKDQLSHTEQPSVVTVFMDEFSDVAQDIEDCLDQFLPCAACGGETVQSRKKEFLAEITGLRKKLDGAHRRKVTYVVKNQASSSASASSNAVHTTHQDMGTYEACPSVGMEEPTQEIGELLVAGEAGKLKVISIVGFGGSGKTALAWAVYNCDKVKEQFRRLAWVVASEHEYDAQGLLTAILNGLLRADARDDSKGRWPAILTRTAKEQAVPRDLGQLQQHIRHQLETNRCLIVIDDIKLKLWGKIERIFPEKETKSRILVTTDVTSVARICSFHGGHVYNMRSLSAKHSKDYLKKKVFVNVCSHSFERGSSAIVNKCAGNPLALVSVANDLRGSDLTAKQCEDIGEELCSRMDEDENGHFKKLVQVLMNSYSSLPDNSHKNCLLYTSVFPSELPFSTNSLIRRLSAEGYIEGTNNKSDLEVAYENLEKLIDRNIIQPIDARTNSRVKTCKTHGIMSQFMLHRSRSSGFIAYFGDKNQSNCRHLVIQNQRNGTIPYSATTGKCKQLRPRSLTVYGSAGEAVSNFMSCELLRVLDLKECVDLNNQHIVSIYKLLHLKYLTLGGTVTKLPDEMRKLHCLETLDLRKTEIETLPLEVISLPHLAHLLGKIKIKNTKNRQNFNLQTLAGVVVDSKSGFPELMPYMKKLTKVKIWCEISSTDRNYPLLSKAIHEFAQTGTGTAMGTRSLSLRLNDSSKYLLDTPSTVPGFLSSLKLHGRPSKFPHGRPSKFPQFVKSLSGIEELCLTYNNLTVDDLSKIGMIPDLLYLKVVEVHLEGLHINLVNFPKLERLCFVVQEPRFPTIQQGDLPSPLVSLQLLCKDLEGHCNHIHVESFGCLQEIALDCMVRNETKQIWEKRAKQHPKRPRVLFLGSVGPAGKYVTVDRGSLEPPVQGMA